MKTLTIWDPDANRQIGPTHTLSDDATVLGLRTKPPSYPEPDVQRFPEGVVGVSYGRPVPGVHTLTVLSNGEKSEIRLPPGILAWSLAWDWVPRPPAAEGLSLVFEDQFEKLDTTRWLPDDWDKNEASTADQNPRDLAHNVWVKGHLTLTTSPAVGEEAGGLPLLTTACLKSVSVEHHDPRWDEEAQSEVPVDDTVKAGRFPLFGYYEIRAMVAAEDWVRPVFHLEGGGDVDCSLPEPWAAYAGEWHTFGLKCLSIDDGVRMTPVVDGVPGDGREARMDTLGVVDDPAKFWRLILRTDATQPGGGAAVNTLVDWVRVWA